MTESNVLPWDSLTKPAPQTGYVWLRTNLSEKFRFWWGKHHSGSPVLLFELDGDHSELFRNKRLKVKGIDIDVVTLSDSGKHGLIVSLTRQADSDIFHRLCLSLIRATQNADDEAQAMLAVWNHLDRWRDFLSNARRRVLSGEEIRGLLAELTVIRLLNEEYGLTQEEIIAAWQGPFRKPQDFGFPVGFIEVKAVGGSRGNVVRISSEHQLETDGLPLFLLAIELFEVTDSSGQSLNELARSLESNLSPELARLFRDRLTIAGYAEIAEYDSPLVSSGRIHYYRVADDFTAIRASTVGRGISRVRYDLDLNTVQSFLVPRLDLWDTP